MGNTDNLSVPYTHIVTTKVDIRLKMISVIVLFMVFVSCSCTIPKECSGVDDEPKDGHCPLASITVDLFTKSNIMNVKCDGESIFCIQCKGDKIPIREHTGDEVTARCGDRD